jgi:hypothetical protein
MNLVDHKIEKYQISVKHNTKAKHKISDKFSHDVPAQIAKATKTPNQPISNNTAQTAPVSNN